MKEKVIKFIQEEKLIDKKDKVLVALSGGPDSVCLLYILYSVREELNFEIGVAHINHMLRGNDSDYDEEFTRNLCDRLEIEYYCKRIDIDRVSKENNMSHELSGREERYKFFEEVCNTYGYNKVAIAHNLNDNAETVLMRLMRGTGLDGLIGIRSKRGEKVIRPILCLTREEIERYIYDNNIETCLDKTNLEKVYTRNKIRLDLIPYMKENFNEDIIISINRMTKILDIDNDYLEKESEKAFNKYVTTINSFDLCIDKDIFDCHKAIVSRVIRKSLMMVADTYMNFENKHIIDVINLSSFETGKMINLPNNIYVENVYGDIAVKKNISIYNPIMSEVILKKEQIIGRQVEFADYSIKFEKILNKNNKQISNNILIKQFDYDKIKEGVQIRTRKDGDKFKPLGMKGNKKLKDVLINLKVPRGNREYIPLICFDDEIAWIVGYRVSETFKVCKETKNILEVTISRKE